MGRDLRSSTRCALLASFTAWLGTASLAAGWSPMQAVSHASAVEQSTPAVFRGASGNLHLVYINKGSPWQVYYRSRSPAGTWEPIESLTAPFSTRPDVIEDSVGRANVVFAATNTDGALDLVHAIRTDNGWTTTFITTTAKFEDQPHLALDSAGVIHMAFTRTNVESSSGEVVYRSWDGASWGSETILGNVTNAYYHRPDISVDDQNNVHVVWVEKSGSTYKVRYRRRSSGTWSALSSIGSAPDGMAFFSYAKIAASDANRVLAVWHDDTSGGGSNLIWNHSSDAGQTWAFALSGSLQGRVLYAGHYPTLAAADGVVHLVSNLEPGEKILAYSRWNGSVWTPLQQLVASNSVWKGWPGVAAEPGGGLHVVWNEPDRPQTGQSYIAYSTTTTDGVPTTPITGFAANARHGRVTLSWTNPDAPDYQRTIIRVSTSAYPISANEGESVADRTATPGATDSVEHVGLVNGTTYYYAAFARDTEGLYSTTARASATPYAPPDLDLDGDVDQSDFALFQRCLSGAFQPQTDPGCEQALFDVDSDVDQEDAVIFMGCLSGPNVPYAPGCADVLLN